LARVARFYGWSDAAIGQTRYRRLLVYSSQIPTLAAEEDLRWLILLHPRDPKELAKELRKSANLRPTPAGQRGTVDEWMQNPHLAGGVTVLDADAFAAAGPSTAS
jgi:hypothetical protein